MATFFNVLAAGCLISIVILLMKIHSTLYKMSVDFLIMKDERIEKNRKENT
jgi:hypothetical protein